MGYDSLPNSNKQPSDSQKAKATPVFTSNQACFAYCYAQWCSPGSAGMPLPFGLSLCNLLEQISPPYPIWKGTYIASIWSEENAIHQGVAEKWLLAPFNWIPPRKLLQTKDKHIYIWNQSNSLLMEMSETTWHDKKIIKIVIMNANSYMHLCQPCPFLEISITSHSVLESHVASDKWWKSMKNILLNTSKDSHLCFPWKTQGFIPWPVSSPNRTT